MSSVGRTWCQEGKRGIREQKQVKRSLACNMTVLRFLYVAVERAVEVSFNERHPDKGSHLEMECRG